MGPLAFFSAGPWELLICGLVAVLLFGKRLPEVGRSLGRGLVEFKRGLRSLEDEIEEAGSKPRPEPPRVERPANAPNAGLPPSPKPDSPPADQASPPSAPGASDR